ncbi:MAG: L-threonylcarbamoyladenylate synthase [Oscillospiraceae bacterium]|nr:L-threonylcarbamoyladenylate synthase [Oscillospiraceae bacterium]
METEILKVSEENLDYAAKRAAQTLLDGGIIGLPTETVYGLAANTYDTDAVRKIFRVKGRPQDNPLIVHVSDFVMLKDVAEVNARAVEMAKVFWPGPLTMVLTKKPVIDQVVNCGLPTVAVRMPSHPVAQAVITAADVPLAAPSANISGRPSTTSAQHVADDLKGKIPLILDGGNCEIGVESTVISLVGRHPVILRPGIISIEMIRDVFPDTEYSEAVFKEVGENERIESPGMKYKHYSPRAEVVVIKSTLQQFIDYVSARAGDGVCAMCFDSEQEDIMIPSVSYGKKGDGFSQAKRLFTVLRMMDKLGSVRVFVRAPDETNESMAVFNRLYQASGFQVVEL